MPQGYNLHFSIKGWEFLHQFLANFSPKKFRFSIAFFRSILYNNQCSPRKGGHCAGVLELVDEVDSKSIASDGVRVRFPPPVPRNPPRVLCSGRVLLCFAVFVSINCCVVNLCCFWLPQFCPLTAPKDALHICPSYPAASCGDGGREIRCWATIKSHDSFKGKTVEFV